MNLWRILLAFLYGVMLGVLWECASMGVLLAATLVEHFCGTLVMAVIFLGFAAMAFAVAARADLGRPLLSILVFRLSAQLAMTIGTGSILLTTMLHDTPACTSDLLRTAGWPAPLLRVLRVLLPHQWLRRIQGVEPPYGPPFLRVLAAVISREWLGWMPSFGLPYLMALPGTITFKPGVAKRATASASMQLTSAFGGWLPGGTQELTGVYTYACRDVMYGDFYYLFRYQAFWMRPAAMVLLHAFGSLLMKMLLMHAYAALFMLLAQGNCRDAFRAEVKRRLDRLHRRLWPRPPVRLIPLEAGDLCAFCHEELLPAAEASGEGFAGVDAGGSSRDVDGGGAWAEGAPPGPTAKALLHCRWGCGKAVHRECAASWGRNSCVYCSAPMV
mmetsp:Transcript_39068/g.91406  ORF Transcript_39068/g.91406 Transcript_39068/m.91406 type:complete len:386 (-) Transcript_39068:946-2103(-)